MQKKKKRPITLIEMIIVIVLIGLIGGVVSYNLRGTLDRGKNFRSKEGAKKLEDLLNLELQIGTVYTIDELFHRRQPRQDRIRAVVDASGLASDPEKCLQDGWGNPYTIERDPAHDRIIVRSLQSEAYEQARSHQP